MLGREKDLLVTGQRVLKRSYGGLPSNYEGSHKIRKDDHVANGHHRQRANVAFFVT